MQGNVPAQPLIPAGTVLEVYWTQDKGWHAGTVIRHDLHTGFPVILYTCGTIDILNPQQSNHEIRVRLLDEGSPGDEKHHYIFTSKGIQTYTPKDDDKKQISSPPPLTTTTPISSSKAEETLPTPTMEDVVENDGEEEKKREDEDNGDVEDSPATLELVKNIRTSLSKLWKQHQEDDKMTESELKTKIRSILEIEYGVSHRIMAKHLGCAQSTFSLWMTSPRISNKSYVGKKLGSWLLGS